MKYFFLLFPLILTAQITNIKGFVKSESGALGFASISLVDTEFGIISDENGYFELEVKLKPKPNNFGRISIKNASRNNQ